MGEAPGYVEFPLLGCFTQVLIQSVMNHSFSEEERELAEVILKLEVCGFPLSVYTVRLLAFQYAHINCIKDFSTKCQIDLI